MKLENNELNLLRDYFNGSSLEVCYEPTIDVFTGQVSLPENANLSLLLRVIYSFKEEGYYLLEKWGVDSNLFCHKLTNLSEDEAVMIIDDIKEFWHRGPSGFKDL